MPIYERELHLAMASPNLVWMNNSNILSIWRGQRDLISSSMAVSDGLPDLDQGFMWPLSKTSLKYFTNKTVSRQIFASATNYDPMYGLRGICCIKLIPNPNLLRRIYAAR